MHAMKIVSVALHTPSVIFGLGVFFFGGALWLPSGVHAQGTFSLSAHSSHATSTTAEEELLHSFDTRFFLLDSLYISTCVTVSSAESSFTTSIEFPSDSLPLYRITRQKEKMALKELNSRNGLQVSGQNYYRVKNGGNIEEDDYNSHYRAKTQTELTWNPLQSSLYKHNGKKRIVTLKTEAEIETYHLQYFKESLKESRESIVLHYDTLLFGVLRHYLDNLLLLEQAEEYLLASERASSDRLLEVFNEKSTVEQAFSGLSVQELPNCDTFRPQLPAAHRHTLIDTLSLFSHLQLTNSDIRLAQLRAEQVEQERQNTTYLQQVSISPYIRYSGYMKSGMSYSANVDAGFSFKLPLSAEAGKKRKVLDMERRTATLQGELLQENIMREAHRTVTDIYCIDQTLDATRQRLNKMSDYLKMRKEAYKQGKGDFNRLTRLREYNLYLSTLKRWLELSRQKDFMVLDIQSLLPYTPVSTFIK